MVCKHKPTTKEGGGLCIYVKNGIHYKLRNDITFLNNNVSYYDCLFIEISNNTHDATHKNLLIGSIYRSLDSNTHNLFTQDLDQITKRMQNENKHIIIYVDANLSTRDHLSKKRIHSKVTADFNNIDQQYKQYRNLLTRVIRNAKSQYWNTTLNLHNLKIT